MPPVDHTSCCWPEPRKRSEWPCSLALPVHPPSNPSNSWSELDGRNHSAGHMPSEVSGIWARIWTYHPLEGSVKLEVMTPETHLNPLE